MCSPGETTVIELVLDVGKIISGRVIDREGQPLAGWNCYADPSHWSDQGVVHPRNDRTDADGRFLLANLGDCPHSVSVSAPGEIPVPPRARVEEVLPGTEDLEIVVGDRETPSAHLRGGLTAEDGSVPSDASVIVFPVGSSRGLFAVFDSETGAFRRGPLMPGSYQLVVDRGGRGVLQTGVIHLAGGERRDLGILRIEAPGRIELSIHGIPEDHIAQLEPTADHGFSTEELVFEDGRFRSPELAPGTWLVRVRRDWLCVRDALVEVTSGETAVIERKAEWAFWEVHFTFEVADDDDPWQVIEAEIRDAQGGLVAREPYLPRRHANEGILGMGGLALPQGRFSAEAWTDTGRRARAELVGDVQFGSRHDFTLVLR